ncbi:MAG: cytidine deaminase [Enterobacter hormaechei]
MRQRRIHVFKLLSQLAEKCNQPWLRFWRMPFPALLTADQVTTLKQATGLDEDALAFALLPLAAACARADLSHFNVGAIARGVSGTWYFGGNMEFIGATMQQTVHAEQSAISHAWLRGEKALRAITVNYTPCGHCRQFMNELNSGLELRINLPGRAPHTLGDYLPDAFGPKDLEIKTLLMDEQDHGYALSGMRSAKRPLPPPIKATPHTANHQAASPFSAATAASSPAAMQRTPRLTRRCPAPGRLNLLSLNGYDYPIFSARSSLKRPMHR